MPSFKNMFSSSCFASVFCACYMILAVFNLYGLMYPLTFVDLTTYPIDSFIQPLWPIRELMHMNVYLSTKQKFNIQDFVMKPTDNNNEEDDESELLLESSHTTLLWQQDIDDKTSLSKTFLITTTTTKSSPSSSMTCDDGTSISGSDDSNTCSNNNNAASEDQDPSYQYAINWLDHVEASLSSSDEEGGILSTISAAGQGIESTSILLTLYEKISKHVSSVVTHLFGKDEDDENDDNRNSNNGILDRSTIQISEESPMWKALMNNRTLFVHVVVVREEYHNINTPDQIAAGMSQAYKHNSLLLGQVDLIKYDEPLHIPKPSRYLYRDVSYLLKHYLSSQSGNELPPWNMQSTEQYKTYQMAQQMKNKSQGYPYWKPEVSIKFLMDEDSYPMDLVHKSGMDFVRVPKSTEHPSGIATIPALYVDEIGLTSEKYLPINSTVTSVPLHITFDRSDVDVEHQSQKNKATTVKHTTTAGGISPARWRLLSHLSHSIESQKELGFEQSDIDDLRRLIADTNVTLLGITILASVLHLLFEFLTFKNEVSFWSNNTDLTGLSVRSLFYDLVGQIIIVLYLIQEDSSLLMIVPSAIGCLIAAWKCQRAAGLAFVRVTSDTKQDEQSSFSWINAIPRLIGFELRAVRLEESSKATTKKENEDDDGSAEVTKKKGKKNKSNNNETSKGNEMKKNIDDSLANLQAMSLECDRIATKRLGVVFLPLILLYAIYSLVFEQHTGWYSWFITSASSAVYALGFVLMTPQLFLNYKLKSVAHLPWRVLIYKSLNTFIDDLFSFIIRMPTMARISCFRDDIVFFVYLYQRWLYPVDTSRPVEGGGDGGSSSTNEKNVTETKKKQ